MKKTTIWVGLTLLALAIWLGVGWVLIAYSKRAALHDHTNEASWTLQGQTSLLDCPGQHRWYVTVDDHDYFMGCRDE